MYLISGAIKDEEIGMIAKDYYEKFERLSGKKSTFRNLSIKTLSKGNGSFISNLFDENYVQTIEFLQNKKENSILISLKDGNHYLAYAILTPLLSDVDLLAYNVKDIIIHDEDNLENLANGEINIRFNIYRKIIEHIHKVLEGQRDYILQFDLIDSQDLCDALATFGYIANDNSRGETKKDLIKNGELSMYKVFNLIKGDRDELRLTRKQRKE